MSTQHDRFHDGPFSKRPARDGVLVDLPCCDGPEGCQGAVAMRWVGYGVQCFPRCEHHGRKRLELRGKDARRGSPASY
jgi:hypothetical protein